MRNVYNILEEIFQGEQSEIRKNINEHSCSLEDRERRDHVSDSLFSKRILTSGDNPCLFPAEV
jgi:hypothetical protein